MLNTDTTMFFDTINDVTPAAVEWLHSGSSVVGHRVRNDRSIYYTTKRGISKGVRCFDMPDGTTKWSTWSMRNSYDYLTQEEKRVFDPVAAKKHDDRISADKEKEREQLAKVKDTQGFKVGDILAGSYGYDATLYEFHQVVKVSDTGKTIWTRELRHETKPGYGYNDWKCRPVPNSFCGDAEKHKVLWATWNKEPTPYIKLTSYMSADKVDPEDWHDADNYH